MPRNRVDPESLPLPPFVRLRRGGDLPANWAPGSEPGTVVLRVGADAGCLESAWRSSGHWLILRRPVRVLTTGDAWEVPGLLAEAESEVRQGRIAAGFLAYEAAPAFDPAHAVAPSAAGEVPGSRWVAWFGLYEQALASVELPDSVAGAFRFGAWRSRRSADEQARVIEAIRGWIAAGHVYQVNATHRLEAAWRGDPWSCFLALQRAQRGAHGAFVHAGETIVCSASPEMLLRLRDGVIVTRPMKGTRPRGLGSVEDEARPLDLVGSPKDRAENVMITDMARNDLGRIAEPGSVRVTSLCSLERYPTVWQLVSTATARTTADLPRCLGALFPAASITGAPKVRATELIAELEGERRGIYTGSIGAWGPGGWAEFNVAIRTVTLDSPRAQAEYGTGGGIVWDSTAEIEHAETRWKSAVLVRRMPRFRLLETLRWDRTDGWVRLERHLARLAGSAQYYGFRWDEERIRRHLRRAQQAWIESGAGPLVARLLLDRAGRLELSERAVPPPSDRPWRIAPAPRPVDRTDPFLFHKTTRRSVYDQARRGRPDCDDVVLWNRDGEVTESTIANLAAEIDGVWVTPPVACGLLPGVMRAELLARGELRERIVRLDDLRHAASIRLCNSVRGWIPATFVPVSGAAGGLVSSPQVAPPTEP